MTVKAIFYLKSGLAIEDAVSLVEDTLQNQKELIKMIDKIKESIKETFRENVNGNISFGTTLVRSSDVSAVKFEESK
jgi:hypothetical protein